MAKHVIRAVGIAWYRREDYQKIRAVMADPDKLPATFDKWFYSANKFARGLEARGQIVERVYLDPDEFAEWCQRRGMNIDAKARMTFANEFVGRKYMNQS